MTKQYFDYQNAPEVRSDTVLAFNNKTHGDVHFGHGLTDTQIAFLTWCKSGSFFRSNNPRAAEFEAMLPEDTDYRKDIFNLMHLVEVIRPHTLVFKDNNYIKEVRAVSVVRGLELVLEALGADVRSVFLLLRLSTNEVMKATARIDVETGEWDGKIAAKKGWLVPVWSENEVSLFT